MASTLFAVKPWQDVDGPSLVASAAALQLIPANIPYLVRLQRMAGIGACLPYRPNAPRLSPSKVRALLKDPLVSGPHVRAQEDLYDDLYTAEVSFHGGPRLVAQGLASHGAHTLGLILRSIFSPPGRAALPAAFVEEAELWAHTVLRLSDSTLRRAGLSRGVIPPERRGEEVFVPGDRSLTAFRTAVYYDLDDLAALLPSRSVDLLAELGIRPGEHTFTEGPGPDDGLILTPLLLREDGLIIANPGELITALRHRLIVHAGRHGCRIELARLPPPEHPLHRGPGVRLDRGARKGAESGPRHSVLGTERHRRGVRHHQPIIAAVRNTERIERVVRAALRGLDSGKQAPPFNTDYQVTHAETGGRRINAVTTLVAADRIPDGTVLEYRPYSKPERREMTEWLTEDPRRAQATWSNGGGRNPLQWHADEQWYSPSGLARRMRYEATGVDSSVQGTIRWFVPGEGSLDELALAVRLEEGNEPAEN